METDWQNKLKSIPQRLNHILESELFCDCEFIVGDKKIKCHKVILAASSPVYQAMFYGPCSANEDSNAPICVTDVNYETFAQMISFLYNNEVTISNCDNACKLYETAKKYMLNYLFEDSVSYLERNLDSSNALLIYEFAKFHCDDKLKELSLKLIKKNSSKVLKSERLISVSEDVLCDILEMEELKISSELELVNAVELWANNKAEITGADCPRSVANTLVEKLRFLTLSIDEYMSGPDNSKLLTENEKLEIIRRIYKPNLPPMKNSLSGNKIKRMTVSRLFEANFKFLSSVDQDVRGTVQKVYFRTNTAIKLCGVKVTSIQDRVNNCIKGITFKLSTFGGIFTTNLLTHNHYYPYSGDKITFKDAITLNACIDYLMEITFTNCRRHLVCKVGTLLDFSDENVNIVFKPSYGGQYLSTPTVLSGIIYSFPVH